MTASTSVLKASGKGLLTVDSKSAGEVPIFLRKTYHMIDTCDDNVACWSEDGKTFIVKRPTDFEQRIIPQFFKHSKFSSFVRQLNFYGFRKIKFTESIRIDAALEAQTANFWRFRHEKFVQNRPDLLVEIKRSNSTAGPKKKGTKTGSGSGSAHANAPGVASEDVTVLKSELEVLKTRIAKMTDNIGELTTLVHNVTLQEKGQEKGQQQQAPSQQLQQQQQCQQEAIDESVAVGSKRKKLNVSASASATNANTSTPAADMNMIVDEVCSSSAAAIPVPSNSHCALDDITFTPDAMFPPESIPSLCPEHIAAPADSEEQAFVDELFNSFGEDMAIEGIGIVPDLTCSSSSSTPTASVSIAVSPAESPVKQEDVATAITTAPSPLVPTSQHQDQHQHPNAPDQKLMNNLSDALAVLPKDMQELLVNRLIATITSSDALQSHLDSVQMVQHKKEEEMDSQFLGVVHGHGHGHGHGHHEPNADIALPLAAATLTALMTQFSSAMKDKACVKPKSLPVIPIHA